MAALNSIRARLWRWFVAPPVVTKGRRMRDVAWAMWLTPTIMFSPLLVMLFMMDLNSAIQSLARAPLLFLCFLGLPYALGVAAWIYARRLDRPH